MSHVTSTYIHDYRWPTVNCLVPRAEAPSEKCEVRPGEGGLPDKPWCDRTAPQPPRRPPGECNSPVRGPLVPLLCPETPMYPARLKTRSDTCLVQPPSKPWCDSNTPVSPVVAARVGMAPQQDSSRYDQPNQYLSQLCDKYPQSMGTVTAMPRDELMRRVYADRYRTTYQYDFCTNSDDTARLQLGCDNHNVGSYGTSGTNTSKGPVKIIRVKCPCGCGCYVSKPITQRVEPGGDAEPTIRPLACRPAAVSRNVHFSCCSTQKQKGAWEGVGPPEQIPPWSTEYRDEIGRTGQLILGEKLLHRKIKAR